MARSARNHPMFDLSGRVALVTGAGRGIGYGIASGLLGQGAVVVVNDLHAERAARAASELDPAERAHAVAGDVTERDCAERLVAAALSRFGRLDILVNNAGVPEGMELRAFCEMPEEDWREVIELNLGAVMRMSRAALDPMRERGYGRIVTIVSEAWRAGIGIGVAPYAAGKAGAVGFSRQLSGEVGRAGITVNCVSLGQMNNIGADEAKATRHYPVPRFGTPADAASATVFLCAEESGWITGQCLAVNGGVVTA